jgi:hypothetical protein
MSRGTPSEELVVVAVTESVHPALANRESITYLSPPQTREQARSLVQLLVGHADISSHDGRYAVPVPGGTRTVTIR